MTSISSDLLKESFVKASLHLEKHQMILNNLNVFPVPDGDTGSNMSSSLKAAVASLDTHDPVTLSDFSTIFCDELNSHSRGNSGFILARFFAGFFTGQEDADQNAISLEGLGYRFSQGSFMVNTALFSPTEGTMITIIAAMSEYMRTVEKDDIPSLFQGALTAARQALENTPRELPVLARAGVIDSGALGFILLFDGFLSGLTGIEPTEEKEENYRFPPRKPSAVSWNQELNYRYCTEILIKAELSVPNEELRDFLKCRGNSIALVNEAELIKLHIHTNNPEEIIHFLSEYGVMVKTKVEDMQDQINLFYKMADATDNAVLVCVPGDGFAGIFRNLGAEYHISYDEKLPSVSEISEALDKIDNEHIIIITNNRNIIPAAIMARNESLKAISILPTESVTKGIAAMYGFSENDTIAENAENMTDCQELVKSFSLYQSAMDSQFGDIEIKRGDYFSLSSGEILGVGTFSDKVIMDSFQFFDLSGISNITFFTGVNYSRTNLNHLLPMLIEQNEALEIEVFYGGQSREELIVSLE